MLLVPLLDPAGVGGRHCLPHPERLIANQELYRSQPDNLVMLCKFKSLSLFISLEIDSFYRNTEKIS